MLDKVDISRQWLDQISPLPRSCGYRLYGKGVINPWRVIFDHELFMFADGDAVMQVGQQRLDCRHGCFVIIPPGVRHISHARSRQVMVHWTHFDWLANSSDPSMSALMSFTQRQPLLERPPPAIVPPQLLHATLAEPESLLALHRRFYDQANFSTSMRRRRSSRGLFLSVLLELLEPDQTIARNRMDANAIAERAREMLTDMANQPFDQAPPVQQALLKLGLSYAHQARLFRQCFNMSPAQYVARLRIDAIKARLQDDRHRISEIAANLGFNDLAYFSRFFHTHSGCSPRQYRQRVGAKVL